MANSGVIVSCFVFLVVVLLVRGQNPIIQVTCNGDAQKSVVLYVLFGQNRFLYIIGCATTVGQFGGTGLPSSFEIILISGCNFQWDVQYIAVLTTQQNIIAPSDWSTATGFTCVRVTPPQIINAQVTVSPTTSGIPVSSLVDPVFFMKFTDGVSDKNGADITTANVADLLRFNIWIDDLFAGGANGFDIMIKTITVTNGPITLILTGVDGPNTYDGCQAKAYWGEVEDIQQGYVRVEFYAFLLGGTVFVAEFQTYIVVIEVCAGPDCPNYDCSALSGSPTQAGRRRRDVSNDTYIEEFRVTTGLEIAAYKVAEDTDVTVEESKASVVQDCELCMQKSALYTIISVLVTGILLSLATSVFLFIRSRRLRGYERKNVIYDG